MIKRTGVKTLVIEALYGLWLYRNKTIHENISGDALHLSRPKLLPLMRCQGPLHLLSTITSGQVNSEGPLGTQVNSVC